MAENQISAETREALDRIDWSALEVPREVVEANPKVAEQLAAGKSTDLITYTVEIPGIPEPTEKTVQLVARKMKDEESGEWVLDPKVGVREMNEDYRLKRDNLKVVFDNGNSYSQESPDGFYEYKVTAPSRFGIGAAYTFGNIALLSVDYENVDYASARLYNDSGNSSEFRDENRRISNGLKNSSILRAGVEVRPLEALSLRMGYNMHSSCGSIVDYDGSQMYSYPTLHYISGGVGFRFGSDLRCSLDAGYQQQLRTSDSFTMYSDYEADGEWFTAPAVDGWRTTGKLVMTFTFRF